MASTHRPEKQKITNRPGFKLLTTTQVSKLLSLNPSTIRKWCDEGIITYTRGSGGRRWISMSEVERLRQANAYSTVSDAMERMEAIISERDQGVRDLISEKSGVSTHNMEVIAQKIIFMTKKLEKLEQAAAVKPTVYLSESTIRKITRIVLDEVSARSDDLPPAQQETAPTPAACPDKAGLNNARVVTEKEYRDTIGENQ